MRDRRPSRPADATALATARNTDVPAPLAHATPDAELAEAQLALGRPELASSSQPDQEPFDEGEDEDSLAAELDEGGAGAGGGFGGDGGGFGRGGDGGGGELVTPGGRAPAAREPLLARLVNFLRGSWRELQRVQWPDRRQVFQATGVVIGFVIAAGVFLGLADLVASRLVNLVLK